MKTTTRRAPMTTRMLSDFCRKRLTHVLPPREAERLRAYLIELLTAELYPPMRGNAPDWEQIALAAGIDAELMLAVRDIMRPGFDALERTLKAKRVPRSRKRVVEKTPKTRAGIEARAGARIFDARNDSATGR